MGWGVMEVVGAQPGLALPMRPEEGSGPRWAAACGGRMGLGEDFPANGGKRPGPQGAGL